MTATQALDLHAVLADIRATISRMDDAMDSASENADIATIELARSMGASKKQVERAGKSSGRQTGRKGVGARG